MKRCVLLLCAILVCVPSVAWAKKKPLINRQGNLGLGVGIGSLAYGVSGKYYLSPSGSIQGNMGTQITSSRNKNGDMFALGADYLFEFGAFASANDIDMALGIGPGVGVALSTLGYVAVDLNACFSVELLFHELPLDFALEYRPALQLKSRALYEERGRVVYKLGSFGVQMRYYLF